MLRYELITPNWHVILLHYPLALLTLGVLIELFSFLWRRSGVVAAGRWMILLGALSAIPAVYSGLYAFRDVINHDDNQTLAYIVNHSAMTPIEWAMMRLHILWTSVGAGLSLLAVIGYLASSDGFRRRLYLPFLAMVLCGAAVLVMGAWHSGEAVYRHGLAVGMPHAVEATTQPAWAPQLHAAVPPIQLHMVLAGWVTALTLVGIGLAFRARWNAAQPELDEDWYESSAPAAEPPAAPAEPPSAMEEGLSTPTAEDAAGEEVVPLRPVAPPAGVTPPVRTPAAPIGEIPAPVKAARWHMLALLLALGAAAAGLWTAGVLDPSWKKLVANVKTEIKPRFNRIFFHVAFGGAIVVLLLILAMLARWARRSRFVLGIFALLGLAALAGQLWLGILLMYDSADGPLTKYNPESTATSPGKSAEATQVKPAAPTATPANVTVSGPTAPLPTTTITVPTPTVITPPVAPVVRPLVVTPATRVTTPVVPPVRPTSSPASRP